MLKRCLLVVPTYSGKVRKAHLSTPSGSAMIAKRSAWREILPPGHWKVIIYLAAKVHFQISKTGQKTRE
jgi:hypothetical protein